MDELFAVGSTGVICALVLQWLKESTWFPMLSKHKDFSVINRIVSIIVAGVASMGITYTYDDARGVLVISGLTVSSVYNGLLHWFGQWVGQHVAYKKVVCDTEILGDIRNLLQGSSTQKQKE